MDKMMHSKDQENKQLNQKIDIWFEHHFHNVKPYTALHASLSIARDDLKRTLGVSLPAKINPQGDNL